MDTPTPDPAQCHCTHPRICPLFKKMMDKASLHWCQNASEADRQEYQKAHKSPIALTQEAHQFISKYSSDHKADTSNVQIAVLGHSKEQFDTIKDRPYLKKIYLDDLNLGKYHKRFQSNAYAESRAFLCDELFDVGAEYVGTVTASWNIKYKGLSPIDDFPNWPASKALLQSKRDNVLLCANLDNPAIWFGQPFIDISDGVILNYLGFSKRQRKHIEKALFRDLKLKVKKNGPLAALSNQFICHKNLYNRYVTFFRDSEVLQRIDRLFKKYDMSTGNTVTNQRPVAFIIECVTMVWLSMQEDILIIPTEITPPEWYIPTNINHRSNWYNGDKV